MKNPLSRLIPWLMAWAPMKKSGGRPSWSRPARDRPGTPCRPETRQGAGSLRSRPGRREDCVDLVDPLEADRQLGVHDRIDGQAVRSASFSSCRWDQSAQTDHWSPRPAGRWCRPAARSVIAPQQGHDLVGRHLDRGGTESARTGSARPAPLLHQHDAPIRADLELDDAARLEAEVSRTRLGIVT